MAEPELLKSAENVLKQNDQGSWIMPAANLYPHQWLWDSCFTAIGLRHLSIERAQLELRSLLRGQWSNGMLPNIIFSKEPRYHRVREMWRSYVSPYSPATIATSGITQPPMLAEAVWQVGQKLKGPARRSWYQEMLPPLLRYHEWLYAERDPHHEGLIVLLHPYEGGADSSPPWISELRKHNMPLWVKAIETLHLDWVANMFRTDTPFVPGHQRINNVEGMMEWSALHRLRRKAYNSEAILSRSLFVVEDLAFNCILIRANHCLKKISADVKKDLPPDLLKCMTNSELALEQLWDESSGQYYSRSFVGHKLIEDSTAATLLPLYAGTISKERAKRLVELMNNKKWFGSKWPLPSVPLNSPYFEPFRYWQGPVWINMNWLVVQGLAESGFAKEAEDLRQRSLELVERSGFSEYFNPLTGQPAGAPNFSWTAALTIDLIKTS